MSCIGGNTYETKIGLSAQQFCFYFSEPPFLHSHKKDRRKRAEAEEKHSRRSGRRADNLSTHSRPAQHQQRLSARNSRSACSMRSAHSNHSAHGRRNASSSHAPLLTTVATTGSMATGTMATIMAAFPTTVTVPILVVSTRFAWALLSISTGITASSIAAIGSDIMNHGHQTGTTTTTFMSSTLGAAITCTTGGILAFALHSTCSNDLSSTPSGEDLLGTGRPAPRVE